MGTRQVLKEIPDYRKPLEKNACGYCGDSSHSIQKCPQYDFHHDMGEHTDLEWVRGREEVLARRKAKAFGGIMEMYLRKPNQEQIFKIAVFKDEQERKFKERAREILLQLRGKK
jgi:hypothetical protein